MVFFGHAAVDQEIVDIYNDEIIDNQRRFKPINNRNRIENYIRDDIRPNKNEIDLIYKPKPYKPSKQNITNIPNINEIPKRQTKFKEVFSESDDSETKPKRSNLNSFNSPPNEIEINEDDFELDEFN